MPSGDGVRGLPSHASHEYGECKWTMPRASWRPRHVPMTLASGSVLTHAGSGGAVVPPHAARMPQARSALIEAESIPFTGAWRYRSRLGRAAPPGVLQNAGMRTRLQRMYRFEAAHFLPKVPPGHKCARMHGHSYQIDLVIEGDVDPELGWVIDFAEIDEHATPLVRRLDHQVLNEIDGLANPTSELLAVWWWQHLVATLPQLVEVVVSE